MTVRPVLTAISALVLAFAAATPAGATPPGVVCPRPGLALPSTYDVTFHLNSPSGTRDFTDAISLFHQAAFQPTRLNSSDSDVIWLRVFASLDDVETALRDSVLAQVASLPSVQVACALMQIPGPAVSVSN